MEVDKGEGHSGMLVNNDRLQFVNSIISMEIKIEEEECLLHTLQVHPQIVNRIVIAFHASIY